MLVSEKLMISIPGYHVTEQIYSDTKTLVCRGVREKDQQSVIIKLMQKENPTFEEITQFRNQYTITKNLDIPGIIKSYSLENYRNGYALVMEDFGGVSLHDYAINVETLQVKSLQNFLHIAIQIASILDRLHRHQIIHKDIKPANILINPSIFEIKLIDFSIASLLPREIPCLTSYNLLEGTLAYISPEQTGRMNRGIDYRSDFYSLGVTFFELLTGQLPFTTTDPIELVYYHIAKQPPSANDINPNIPVIISKIVSKLMAKNAEDRYQSALGLKHDLEVCQQQWEETGKITPFKLGQKDISDRFLIQEKLYGRKQEVETLLAAFDRVTKGKTEVILVTGVSGSGKTAVVKELYKPTVRTSSYFIQGKFDQLGRDIPLSGLVQAFQDLISQLLSETDAQIQQWKAKILSALGTQGQVIADVIPKLELIIGKQPSVVELSGNANQNRFNLLFQKFIQVFTSKEHPLVIFIDDLQWADAASLKLMQLLMSESDEGAFLLIGAFRDNEVLKEDLLNLTSKEIKNSRIIINTIKINSLKQNDVNCLIADTLRCSEESAVPLTQFVFAKTQGNPFFTHRFLKHLYDNKLIEFNFEVGYWQYDLAKIKILALTDDVLSLMTIQLQRLPIHTQVVLKIAACISNQFDLKTLAMLHQKSEVDTVADLWSALLEGLILPETEGCKLFLDTHEFGVKHQHNYQLVKYKFVHDRVQQAAYSLIPESQKQSTHLKIGQLLLSNTTVEEREEHIFDIVNQFNMAHELITNQTERDELARMNLIAGLRAIKSTAYATAVKYLSTGIKLQADDCWEKNYDNTLALYETAAEAAYLNGDFENTEEFVQVVSLRAKTLLDKVKVFEIKIKAYGAQNKTIEAVNSGLAFLQLLGVEFPENANQFDIQRELEKTISNFANRRIEDLIDLPKMTEAQPLAIMSILASILFVAYQAVPQLFPLIILKQINLSLQHGNAPLSLHAYAMYGLILCQIVGDVEYGYQFGKLALNLLNKFNYEEVRGRVMIAFHGTISLWSQHIKENLTPLLLAYSAGREMGDLEYAATSVFLYSYYSYFIGKDLTDLQREMVGYSNAIAKIKQKKVLSWNAIHQQTVSNLLGNGENACRLIGESYDEEKMLLLNQQTKDDSGCLFLYTSKLHLCYLFHEFAQAVENACLAEEYLNGGMGTQVVPIFHFYDSLSRLAIYPNAILVEQKYILDKVKANQEKMQKWAQHAPMNYLHKFYLVEAEQHRVLGKYLEAIDCYDRAIALAKEHEYINEEALANELAAKFYLEWGKQKIAQIYLTDAYYGYFRWGSSAKVHDLQKRYPQLLLSILQEKQNFDPSQNSVTDRSTSLSTTSNNQKIFGSTKNSISNSIDLTTAIKASQALSSQIELEQLLSTLMQVVMENAGASKCALILSEGSNLKLVVITFSSNSSVVPICTKFPSVNLESSNDVPITLVNYVKRTEEILVIDDVNAQHLPAVDDYIIHQRPKSLLCMPIMNQGKLLGILYLENNLTTAVFTSDRIELLKLITTQAAISIKNAILYNNLAQANERLAEYSHSLEEKVEQRTQELKQTLKDLQNTQAQLIQSEKMSSLGQMIAGIAHEINNPINFIHANITPTYNYVQDLLDLIAVYQQEYPNPSPLVVEKSEEIDLDFLIKDLRKLLNSMNVGTERIRNIVLGLRSFSRLDEAEMKPVDIHEGIDSTLMILQHRLKAKKDLPEIVIIKEYGQLPKVSCYAAQLNQVFMNILTNAIDALEEGVGCGVWGVGKKPNSIPYTLYPTPQIRIQTEVFEPNLIQIRIADNGSGMTNQVQQKIFDPFFTTKPVGSGTGLGLSISYQIVVDKHKGRLTCDSIPGKGTEFIIEIPMQSM